MCVSFVVHPTLTDLSNTLKILIFITLSLISSRLISSRLILSRLVLSRLVMSHLVSSRLVFLSQYLVILSVYHLKKLPMFFNVCFKYVLNTLYDYSNVRFFFLSSKKKNQNRMNRTLLWFALVAFGFLRC